MLQQKNDVIYVHYYKNCILDSKLNLVSLLFLTLSDPI